MEDVLAVYTRPRDPNRPVVCVDETSKQLIAETRAPVAMQSGRPARIDYEYTRNGTANLFMMFAPLEGWRNVKVTDRRTAVDFAHVLKDLADVHFAQAETIVLVQDNLNTHAAASLYEAFPAAEARRLVERFEWHYTPKHGSWLDLAESELGVLAAQCLDRRIPDKQTISDEVAAWVRDRNKNLVTLDLQPTSKMKFFLPPQRNPKADSFSGDVTFFGVPEPGQYQVTVSEQASIDVFENGARLKPIASTRVRDCAGLAKSMRFDLAPGDLVLVQVTGAPSSTIKVAFTETR